MDWEILAQRHTTKSVIILSLNLLKVTAGQRKLNRRKRIIKGFPQGTASYKRENLNLEEIIKAFANGFLQRFAAIRLSNGSLPIRFSISAPKGADIFVSRKLESNQIGNFCFGAFEDTGVDICCNADVTMSEQPLGYFALNIFQAYPNLEKLQELANRLYANLLDKDTNNRKVTEPLNSLDMLCSKLTRASLYGYLREQR